MVKFDRFLKLERLRKDLEEEGELFGFDET